MDSLFSIFGITQIAIGIIFMALVIATTVFSINKRRAGKLREHQFYSSATVTKKIHKEKITVADIMKYGKHLIISKHNKEEAYFVFLSYNGMEYCVNDKELYNRVETLDIILVVVHQKFNKKGQLKEMHLSAKE